MRRLYGIPGIISGIGLAVSPAGAVASETITYTYDAKGRVIKVERAGAVNNNVKSEYVHDKADNRTNVKTAGSSS